MLHLASQKKPDHKGISAEARGSFAEAPRKQRLPFSGIPFQGALQPLEKRRNAKVQHLLRKAEKQRRVNRELKREAAGEEDESDSSSDSSDNNDSDARDAD